MKDYNKAGEYLNAAGLKFLNETFRCLVHTELDKYGKEIWDRCRQALGLSRKYLEDMKQHYGEKGNDDMVSKLTDAMNCLGVVPFRYK